MHDTILARLRARGSDESGVALIAVVLFVLVAAALGSIVAVEGISGLRNANRDRASGAAQAISDTGVAEAMGYIRVHNLGTLQCMEPLSPGSSTWETAAGCTTAGWTDPLSPEVVSGGSVSSGTSCPVQSGTDCYEVWIGTIQSYLPGQGSPATSNYVPPRPAILRIHSTGFSGVGPGARAVAVDVTATPASFPLGVFGNSVNEPSDASAVQSESIFTSGNITVKCGLTGWDYAYNIPAAIHAAGTITYAGGNCGGNIPNGYSGPAPIGQQCMTNGGAPEDPYDQDGYTGNLKNGTSDVSGPYPNGSVCQNYDQVDPAFTSISSKPSYSGTSLFTAQSLGAYGYMPGGLTTSEYSDLKAEAASEGTYDNEPNLATVLKNLVAQGVTNPVIYDDNGSAPTWGDLTSVPQFFRSPSSSGTIGSGGCSAYSVTIIVRNGAINWNGNPPVSGESLVASIFVPDQTSAQYAFSIAGNVAIIGTLFAYSESFNGNTTPAMQLDPCFIDNPPTGVLDLNLVNYHGVDTGNLQ